jgi:SAM-dependent methyltransferase
LSSIPEKYNNVSLWDEIHGNDKLNIADYETPFPNRSTMAFYQHYVLKNKLNTPLSKWLDFGCGSGSALLNLYKFGLRCNLTATDVSPRALIKVQKNFSTVGVEIETMPLVKRHLDVEDNSFDFINAEGSIYYDSFEGVKSSIKELHRILKPGGYLRFTILSDRDRYALESFQKSENTYKVLKAGHWEHDITLCCLSRQSVFQIMDKFESTTVGYEDINYTGCDETKSNLIVTGLK